MEWSTRAAEADKHLLCEKPLASSVADAIAMFAAARQRNVHLVEAYPRSDRQRDPREPPLITPLEMFRNEPPMALT